MFVTQYYRGISRDVERQSASEVCLLSVVPAVNITKTRTLRVSAISVLWNTVGDDMHHHFCANEILRLETNPCCHRYVWRVAVTVKVFHSRSLVMLIGNCMYLLLAPIIQAWNTRVHRFSKSFSDSFHISLTDIYLLQISFIQNSLSADVTLHNITASIWLDPKVHQTLKISKEPSCVRPARYMLLTDFAKLE